MPRGIKADNPINPFRFGALALDEAFADREQEVADLVADARNGQDVVIFAPRRYGKSSLVWKASQKLIADQALVAQVDLMTTPTKEKLAEKLAASIYENIASALERAKEKALAPFHGLRIQPSITVNPEDGRFSFSFGVAHARAEIDETLERLLQLPAELGASKGRPVVLIMDEFQEILEIDPDLPRLLRSIFQQQPEIAHIYLGSKRHTMERIFSDDNVPFWRSAKSVELQLIEPRLFAEFIAARFRQTGKKVEAGVVEAILARTNGHPYATQELCYFLWEQVSAGETAGDEHLQRGLAGVLASEHTHFTLLWEEASTVQKLVLQALAREQPGRPFTAEYRRAHELPAVTNVQKALRAMLDRETVAAEDGAYRIAEPFLADWIKAQG